jgi:hypothetical protein
MRLFCLLLIITPSLFGVASCSKANSSTSRFDENLKLWKSKNIVNYRYKLAMTCYCPAQYLGPNLIEVRDGKAESITYAGDAKNINMKRVILPDTIEKVFETARGEKSVSYEPTYGYPMMIHKVSEPGTQDRSTIYSVRDFEVIKDLQDASFRRTTSAFAAECFVVRTAHRVYFTALHRCIGRHEFPLQDVRHVLGEKTVNEGGVSCLRPPARTAPNNKDDARLVASPATIRVLLVSAPRPSTILA